MGTASLFAPLLTDRARRNATQAVSTWESHALMPVFPDLPIYTGYNRPGRIECQVRDLEVEGRIPAELNGIFYRVAPDPHWPPKLGRDVYFNGDGMVCAFDFRDGHVDLKTRYVRTAKFLAEEAARGPLFGPYRNPFFDDASVAGLSRGTANTNVLLHHGRLLALKEDSRPVAMDADSLETLGEYDFEGALDCPTFTAHPKIDPVTGEMIAFGYAAGGLATRDVAYFVFDARGKLVHEVRFEAPYYAMLHDFGVTEDYVIFPVAPVVGSLERCRQGLPHFGWDASKPVHLGVLPRRGSARDLRWFTGPTQFASHVMNAFNEGEKIHIDMPVAEGNAFPFFPDITGARFDPGKGRAFMTRWTMDMGANGASYQAAQLSDFSGEFPRIDDRYATKPHRHAWWVVHDPSRPFDPVRGGSIGGPGWNAWTHCDLATGKRSTFYPGPTSTVQEIAFAPRSADAPEGDGFILGLVNRFESMSTDLMVMDAQKLDAGPLATVHLPVRLRNGLHGNWVPRAVLNLA
jgi:carotenoid cleavage dioxygenase